MPGSTCHYCNQPAIEDCPTCGRLYCADHGEDACVRCMAPESAGPSAGLYRGSLLALAVTSALGIYLLVSPPEEESKSDTRSIATLVPGAPTATSTRTGVAAPVRTATPAATPSPPPTVVRTHTVAGGDTLSAIAARYGVTEAAIQAANLSAQFEPLAVGQVLTIP